MYYFLLVTLLTSGCSGGKFAGEGEVAVRNDDLQKLDYTPPPVTVPSCPSRTELDPDAQFVFPGSSEVTHFIAQATGAPMRNGTATFADQATADFICKKKGYKRSTGMVTGRFHSCEDNYFIYYNPATDRTGIRNSCSQNTRIDSLVCIEKDVTVDCNGNPLGG